MTHAQGSATGHKDSLGQACKHAGGFRARHPNNCQITPAASGAQLLPASSCTAETVSIHPRGTTTEPVLHAEQCTARESCMYRQAQLAVLPAMPGQPRVNSRKHQQSIRLIVRKPPYPEVLANCTSGEGGLLTFKPDRLPISATFFTAIVSSMSCSAVQTPKHSPK